MTSEIESQISRVINKLENAKKDFNYFPTTNATQEGNYRMQKKIAGAITQVNVNVSSFDAQNESNIESINEISNSFSEQPSDLIEQSLPKPNLKRRTAIILDLNKIINIGEYKIELGQLLNILDKKLPEDKENNSNANNDISKTYTQCTTEENERRKSFISPEKKKENNDYDSENNDNSNSNKKKKKKSSSKINNNDYDVYIKDKKFNENLAKKYHKISLLLKAYLNENKLVNELNKKSQKENIINNYNYNYNVSINDTHNMNMNNRRKSLFDTTSYIIPSESSFKSFSKNNQLPNLISNFFKHRKGGKKKKRNSYVSGQLCNKLKQLNQQLQGKSTSKKIPQSEKAEFKIKPTRSSISNDSNIQLNNVSNKKNISQISNFDMSNNCEGENESIINNDNSVFYGNENKITPLLFNEGLSAVKKRRQSDFFENIPQQQEEITGFHKMISTIIEEEDNNYVNYANANNNNDEKKEICDDENKNKNMDNKVNDDENCVEDENGEEDDVDDVDDDEEEDDTILNDDGCYNGNISTSLCFDDLITF